MSSKSSTRKRASASKKPQAAPQKSGISKTWIIAAVAVAAIAITAIVASQGSGGGSAAGSSAGEKSYAGRLLPESYEAATVAERTLYTNTIRMTPVVAVQDDSGFTIPVDALVTNKIVSFDYTRPDGTVLPMLAYVRPSGKLFVGVSYCPPCEGEGQRIETDGTLTCESCGTRRNLEDNSGLSGACKLYPLDEVPATVTGSDIMVDNTVLDTWTAQPLDRPIG